MRARRLPLVLLLGVLLLAGCVPKPVDDPVEPAPSVAPIFASEEEALAAAVAAYEQYLKVSDEIAADGGANPERLQEVAGAALVDQEVAGFEEFAAAGFRSTGRTVILNPVLQQWEANPVEGQESIWMYVCSDVSGVDVINVDGVSVVSPDRPSRAPLQVGLTLEASRLLVSSKDVWPSDDICG